MLKKIKSWFTANKLTLNISKTSYILCTPSRQMQETCLKLYFDNNNTGEHLQDKIVEIKRIKSGETVRLSGNRTCP